MGDMDRAAMTRLVYSRLANPLFRDRLVATAPDGSHPIKIAMPEDSMKALVRDIAHGEGAANVFVPLFNGLMGLVLTTSSSARMPSRRAAPRLADDCTVGLFVQRLLTDHRPGAEAPGYAFVLDDEQPRQGRAQLVAVAG